MLCQCLIFNGCTNADGTSAPSAAVSTGTVPVSAPTETDYWQDGNSLGLQVVDGQMLLADEVYYAAGVNCYSLFNQCFGTMSAQKAKESLDVLKQYDVKVVRFNCGGYSYRDFNYYENQREAYLALLLEITEYAAQLEIGLIPSLFWLSHAVPDYVDEPIRSWGKADSQTIAFMKQYTTDVVTTLRGCKALFAWEFGNELNLGCDLPNAAEHMPALPYGSSRNERTEQDFLSVVDVNYAMTEFAALIRVLDDSGRMITSGNASQRPSQYNQLHYNTWKEDTLQEYAEVTALLNPGQMDCVSEHTYFISHCSFGTELTLREYLQEVIAVAKQQNKAYFIGEWGGGSYAMERYEESAQQIMDSGVQLSLLWNYNLEENSVEYSFSAETKRGQALLSLIGEMNSQYNRRNTDE